MSTFNVEEDVDEKGRQLQVMMKSSLGIVLKHPEEQVGSCKVIELR